MGKEEKDSCLGRALRKDRFSKTSKLDQLQSGFLHCKALDEDLIANKGLQSITDSNDLEAFFELAQLTKKKFVGEKLNINLKTNTERINVKIITKDEEKMLKSFLKIPRRPNWTKTMTVEELNESETEVFINWRRDIAKLQQNDNFLFTPFEKNLEVWRQLWRVIEKSSLVIQVVDCRNPLLFYCSDLSIYVKEVHSSKRNFLLLNKCDFLTIEQRKYWEKCFKEKKIEFAFWSAKKSSEETNIQISDEVDMGDASNKTEKSQDSWEKKKRPTEEQGCCILNSEELLQRIGFLLSELSGFDISVTLPYLFSKTPCNYPSCESNSSNVIGMVGYPNVGKSSTINALLKRCKVSVSSRPGKTKHFQTHKLSDNLILMDCPGLVFPNFVSSKSEMICNGILPIDQVREPYEPALLLAQRITRTFFEETYGMYIVKPHPEENPNRAPTGHELLHAFGNARGYMTSHGVPDVQKSVRILLKDYVNGKLLYCHPPPGVSTEAFNPHLKEIVHQTCSTFVEQNNSRLFSTSGQIQKNLYTYERFGDDEVLTESMQSLTALVKGKKENTISEDKDELGRPIGKPWLKHHNRNKKEKQRRIFDQKANKL